MWSYILPFESIYVDIINIIKDVPYRCFKSGLQSTARQWDHSGPPQLMAYYCYCCCDKFEKKLIITRFYILGRQATMALRRESLETLALNQF